MLNDTNVADIDFLADFHSLRTLYLSHSQVTDLSPISGLTRLRVLHLRGLGITDLSFLSGIERPFRLWLENNSITSIAPLVANPAFVAGDFVGLSYNDLDLEDPDVMADIQTLIDRGVSVTHEPQN